MLSFPSWHCVCLCCHPWCGWQLAWHEIDISLESLYGMCISKERIEKMPLVINLPYICILGPDWSLTTSEGIQSQLAVPDQICRGSVFFFFLQGQIRLVSRQADNDGVIRELLYRWHGSELTVKVFADCHVFLLRKRAMFCFMYCSFRNATKKRGSLQRPLGWQRCALGCAYNWPIVSLLIGSWLTNQQALSALFRPGSALWLFMLNYAQISFLEKNNMISPVTILHLWCSFLLTLSLKYESNTQNINTK